LLVLDDEGHSPTISIASTLGQHPPRETSSIAFPLRPDSTASRAILSTRGTFSNADMVPNVPFPGVLNSNLANLNRFSSASVKSLVSNSNSSSSSHNSVTPSGKMGFLAGLGRKSSKRSTGGSSYNNAHKDQGSTIGIGRTTSMIPLAPSALSSVHEPGEGNIQYPSRPYSHIPSSPSLYPALTAAPASLEGSYEDTARINRLRDLLPPNVERTVAIECLMKSKGDETRAVGIFFEQYASYARS
jgi:hypothetical protein